MESEMDLIRMDYKRKLISQIGVNIKGARQTDNEEEKRIKIHYALSLWIYGVSTNLLNRKQAKGINKQISELYQNHSETN